jgi:hypothetical protein
MLMAWTLLATAVVAMGAPTRVSARGGRWQDVLAPAASRGGMHGPARPTLSSPSPAPDNSAREPLRVSDAPAEKIVIERVRSRELEHSAGDRLREALASAAQNDPKSAAKIARLIAQAAAEARRNRALGDRVWYWRDPFSQNPRQPIVLSLEAQLEMQLAATRQETARAHVESAAARAEAATAHAEAARARTEALRAQEAAERGHPMIVRRESRPAHRGAGVAARTTPTIQARDPESPDDVAARRRAARRLQPATLAQNERSTAQAGGARHRDIGAARAISAPAGGREAPSTDPGTGPGSDPRGIVIVPIHQQPVAALPRR